MYINYYSINSTSRPEKDVKFVAHSSEPVLYTL